MKKCFFLLTFVFVFVITQLQGQDYKSAVGARLGSPLSISYKTFISEQGALEGYIGFRGNVSYNWVSISGAYLHHQPLEIEDIQNLKWYVGGGGSVMFWNYPNSVVDDFSSTALGIQGYLGLEYTFDDIPLNLTIDWIPTVFVGGNLYINNFGVGYGSLGVRYILK